MIHRYYKTTKSAAHEFIRKHRHSSFTYFSPDEADPETVVALLSFATREFAIEFEQKYAPERIGAHPYERKQLDPAHVQLLARFGVKDDHDVVALSDTLGTNISPALRLPDID